MINRKIADREHHIAELKKLLVYYKEITETIREPFIILDKNLFVVTANQAFYRKFQVRKKDTDGRLVYELGNKQWDIPELRELLESILPKHRKLNDYNISLDFPILGQKTMLLNARQVDSKQLILLAMEDITAQSALKIQSDESTANLIKQRDRLLALNDAKDEFIQLASHQLRTPATIVKQYIGMLTQDYAGEVSHDQRKMLNIAYASNERQLEIIEELLRVAKLDAGKVYLNKTDCDLVQLVQTVILEQTILFKGRGQTVVLNKPNNQVVASIDKRLILMVIENLLDNAGKYSQVGTQITIDVEQNELHATVSIKDNGVGIHESDHKRLFKKFSRIDNPLTMSVTGTGLGLYWVRKILSLHEGTVEVTSKINEGSTFSFKTPIRVGSILKPGVAISA